MPEIDASASMCWPARCSRTVPDAGQGFFVEPVHRVLNFFDELVDCLRRQFRRNVDWIARQQNHTRKWHGDDQTGPTSADAPTT